MNAEEMQQAVSDLFLLRDKTITLELPGGLACSLFATLQRVVRESDGRVENLVKDAEKIALDIQKQICLTPALTRFFEDGWHPEEDWSPGKLDPLDFVPGRLHDPEDKS